MNIIGHSVTPIPLGYHSISPFLILNDLAGFLDFLREAFDAQEVRRLPGRQGTVAHAQVRMGDSHIMLGSPTSEHSVKPAMLHFYVRDVDAVFKQALKAGASSLAEPTDGPHGDRTACVQDDWGNVWLLATHVEDVSEGELLRRSQEAQDAPGSSGERSTRST